MYTVNKDLGSDSARGCGGKDHADIVKRLIRIFGIGSLRPELILLPKHYTRHPMHGLIIPQ